MTGLYLGPVSFDSFEIPARISFGGAQRLAVHKLLGGVRVIDALGRDDLSLSWSGILSGPEATTRAASLNKMRVAGLVQGISWAEFYYDVVIAQLNFEFCSPWWIPYKISCVVQADLAQVNDVQLPSLDQAITSDLAVATTLLGPSLSQILTGATELATFGSLGRNQALAILSSIETQLLGTMQENGVLLESSDLVDLVSASGSLATASGAAGYLARSIANLGLLGS